MNPEDFEFYWLPDAILSQRRNFTNEILPCNVLPQFGRNYHYTLTGSPYKYMILGPSFHKVLWFDLGQVDQVQLKNELLAKLLTMNC